MTRAGHVTRSGAYTSNKILITNYSNNTEYLNITTSDAGPRKSRPINNACRIYHISNRDARGPPVSPPVILLTFLGLCCRGTKKEIIGNLLTIYYSSSSMN